MCIYNYIVLNKFHINLKILNQNCFQLEFRKAGYDFISSFMVYFLWLSNEWKEIMLKFLVWWWEIRITCGRRVFKRVKANLLCMLIQNPLHNVFLGWWKLTSYTMYKHCVNIHCFHSVDIICCYKVNSVDTHMHSKIK